MKTVNLQIHLHDDGKFYCVPIVSANNRPLEVKRDEGLEYAIGDHPSDALDAFLELNEWEWE